MKRILRLQALILTMTLFCPFVMNAQIDTARLSLEHSDQYIYPPLVDSTYERFYGYDYELYTYTIPSIATWATFPDGNDYFIKGLAQRYELRSDSLRICGVSFFAKNSSTSDTVTVGVMDTSASVVLVQKTFRVSTFILYEDYFEFMFDDTITVHDDYIVFIEFNSHQCLRRVDVPSNNVIFNVAFYQRPCARNNDPVSCSERTLFKPYVSFCYDTEWKSVDDVVWGGLSYYDIAKYRLSHCDRDVYAPLAIFPIRALEDSIPQGDTAVMDTASSALWTGALNDECVRVYPNPADEVLNVASDYNILNVAIFDAVNRLVEEKEVNAKSVRISLAERPSGVYFINVRTDRGSIMRKVIVR